MIAKEFPEVNVRIAEHQPEYETLPAFYNENEGSVTFAFQLNREELDEISKTGTIFFKMLTQGRPMQPVLMSTEKNECIPVEFQK